MAQNTWVNVTIDAAASRKVDNADHRHTVAGGTAAANDLTISWDSAKITSLSILDSAYASARQRAAAGGLK